MAEIVVNIVLDKLTTLMQEEMHLLKGVSEEAVWIADELEQIKAFLRAADEMEDRSHGLDVCVKQLRDVAYDIEDALDEYRLRLMVTHQHGHDLNAFLGNIVSSIKNLKARHQIASEIQRIKSRFLSISDGRQRFQSETNDAKIAAKTWHYHRQNALLVDEADLVGIENPKKQLVSWLIQSLIFVLCICFGG